MSGVRVRVPQQKRRARRQETGPTKVHSASCESSPKKRAKIMPQAESEYKWNDSD